MGAQVHLQVFRKVHTKPSRWLPLGKRKGMGWKQVARRDSGSSSGAPVLKKEDVFMFACVIKLEFEKIPIHFQPIMLALCSAVLACLCPGRKNIYFVCVCE